MRTAHSFLVDKGVKSITDVLIAYNIENMLKEYGEEIILECAERAKTKDIVKEFFLGDMVVKIVDKESILSLINELK